MQSVNHSSSLYMTDNLFKCEWSQRGCCLQVFSLTALSVYSFIKSANILWHRCAPLRREAWRSQYSLKAWAFILRQHRREQTSCAALTTNKLMLDIPFIALLQLTSVVSATSFIRQLSRWMCSSLTSACSLSLSTRKVRRSEQTPTLSLCHPDEKAAVDQVRVCEGLQMIVQSFISSNPVSFRSCTLCLHKNRSRPCELPQPIDPAPQTWIALLWGSPASQTGFYHAWSPNHGNLIYLKPLAVLLEPLYSLF